MTDEYSIENSIVNKNTCLRVLMEIFEFTDISIHKKCEIKDLFDSQLDVFYKLTIPIMACILYWYKTNKNPCLDKIKMDDFFKINKGKINKNGNYKMEKIIAQYIHDKCQIEMEPEYINSQNALEKLIKKKHIRGKYLTWFLFNFCQSIYNDCTNMGILDKKPKMHVALSEKNIMKHISPRAKQPISLKIFLEKLIN